MHLDKGLMLSERHQCTLVGALALGRDPEGTPNAPVLDSSVNPERMYLLVSIQFRTNQVAVRNVPRHAALSVSRSSSNVQHTRAITCRHVIAVT